MLKSGGAAEKSALRADFCPLWGQPFKKGLSRALPIRIIFLV